MNENYQKSAQAIPADAAYGADISRGTLIGGKYANQGATNSPVRPAPITGIFANSLDKQNERAADLLNRLEDLANRLFGEAPPMETKGKTSSLSSAGIIGILAERLDNLDALFSRLEDTSARLERMA